MPTFPVSTSGPPQLKALPLSDDTLGRLAHECARDVYPLDDILAWYKIDPAYFQHHIINHPRFMVMYAEAHATWNSSSSTHERSALKSAIMFEQWLEVANRHMLNDQEPLSSKVALMQLVAKVSNLMPDDKSGKQVAPGERVVVNINFRGAPPVHIDKVAPVLDVEPTPAGNP